MVIEKDGHPDSVIVSYENFRALKDAANPKTRAQKQREFNEKHKDWFAEQNRLVEELGVFGEEFRPW